MTQPAHASSLGSRLPSESERDAANQLRSILASGAGCSPANRLYAVANDTSRTEIHLTPGLSQLLLELLRHIGRGDAVTLVPISQMLTTQQAADILNVSRPHLIHLMEHKGEIPFERVGRHRRIRAEDLFAYKERRARERDSALRSLAEADADLL